EVTRQDRVALDLLEAREVAVDVVDDLLHLRFGLVVRNPLGERDQGGDVGPAIADDERLRDEWMHLEGVLEVLRRDVLATGSNENVLLAVGDGEKAVFVEATEVAGAQPAVP